MMNTDVLKIATLWLFILHSLFSLCFHQTLWIFEDVCVDATTQRPAFVEPFNSHGVIGIFFLILPGCQKLIMEDDMDANLLFEVFCRLH